MPAPRRTTSLVAYAAAAVAVLVTHAPAVAVAVPVTDFEMPFPCAQSWKGTTYSTHSPNTNSIDWNRTDDVDDPVVAAAGGTVVLADATGSSGYGKYVVVDHGSEERSLYAHLNSMAVAKGQWLDQGQLIGTVGNTGHSTAPHLHFEERVNGTTVPGYFHQQKFSYGTVLASQNCVDVPLAPDWNGDRVAQPTVYRRGEPSTFRVYRDGMSPYVISAGASTDEPVAGDWDGNGTVNAGWRTPSTRTFTLKAGTTTTTVAFGYVGDKPIAGNFAGTKAWEVGTWHAATAEFLLRIPGRTTVRVKLGSPDDLPVTGDWDGDGITDLGVYDPPTSTFTLRRVDAGGVTWLASVAFGTAGDLPVTGDWDGNRVTDLGTWTPGTAVFNKREAAAPTTTARATTSLQFGNTR